MTETEVASRLGMTLGRALRGDRIVITRSGRPRAVLVDYKEFEALQAAAGLVQDAQARITMARAADEVRAGNLHRLKGKPSVRRLVGFAKLVRRRAQSG